MQLEKILIVNKRCFWLRFLWYYNTILFFIQPKFIHSLGDKDWSDVYKFFERCLCKNCFITKSTCLTSICFVLKREAGIDLNFCLIPFLFVCFRWHSIVILEQNFIVGTNLYCRSEIWVLKVNFANRFLKNGFVVGLTFIEAKNGNCIVLGAITIALFDK